MIVVRNRASLVAAGGQNDRAIGRAIATEFAAKKQEGRACASGFTNPMPARIDQLRAGTSSIDIRPHGDPIDLKIEPCLSGLLT